MDYLIKTIQDIINEIKFIFNEMELVNILTYYYLNITDLYYLDVDEYFSRYNMFHEFNTLNRTGITIYNNILSIPMGSIIRGSRVMIYIKCYLDDRFDVRFNSSDIKILIENWCKLRLKQNESQTFSVDVKKHIIYNINKILEYLPSWNFNVNYM